ncbi:MAG: DCC1-like thiol-disulfide oxidoreductase family protein [Nitrospinae bacterium]|nr:DCC1-like thiol-disulfide oxidoreductase family protein [Nitrospinota bacterium]
MTSQEAERTEPAEESAQGDFLLYDGECPFCRFYARKSGFKTPGGEPLTLIDANRAPELIGELRKEGCGVEEGMVLVVDGRRYQGAEAMTALEAMTSWTGWFGGVSKWFASNPARARAFYPWFQRLRRAALWVKRRRGLDREGSD